MDGDKRQVLDAYEKVFYNRININFILGGNHNERNPNNEIYKIRKV